MNAVTERLGEFAREIRTQLEDLIRDHSSLHLSNPPASGILNVSGDHRWNNLSDEGRRVQARLLEEYRRLCSILETLIRNLPGERQRSYAKCKKQVLSVIEQDGSLWAQHVRALAVEPDFDATLPWLDPSNNDDRVLASAIEVMRLYPRSPVVIVTRDVNLQNKAEFAKAAFIEPPDPSE